MIGHGDDNGPATCASPPCFVHEVDPAYLGLAAAAELHQGTEVMRWRKAKREQLINMRLSIPSGVRRERSERITNSLEAAVGDVSGLTVSGYWPIRGEPDLRGFLERIVACGGRSALPVVIARGQPLVFRARSKGQPLVRGIWTIPVPAEEAPVVVPDLVLVPVVGFDPGCYRLGYGGGYFDRTLAAMPKTVRVFGVGYSEAAIRTIYPQPHDIPMDAVVTEDGLLAPAVAAGAAR